MIEGVRKFFNRLLVNVDFVFLVLALLTIYHPVWDRAVWLQHDTFGAFQVFYFFYNDFFFHGSLPRWLPFGFYGAQSHILQIMILTPASYAAMAIGFLCRIRDVLFLFKLSIFFEQLTLLVGTYLLARQLYHKRTTVLFVVFALTAASVWHIQLFQNFRIYYLLPLALYFIFRFFKTKFVHYTWIAGSVFIVSAFGNGFHFLALYLFILIIMFAVAACLDHKLFRVNLFDASSKNIQAMIAFVLLAVLYLYPLIEQRAHLTYYSVGRSSKSMTALLGNFLTYGGSVGVSKFLGLLYAGPIDIHHPLGLDHTLYVGLLPFLFLCYAMRSVKKPEFIACLTALVILASLSVADAAFVARFAYHASPLMAFYRHIGLIGGVLKLFILISAGFGLDQYLSDAEANDTLSPAGFRPRRLLFGCGLLIVASIIVIDHWVNPGGSIYPKTWPNFFYYSFIVFIIGILLLSTRPGGSLPIIRAAALLCLILDLGSYQNLVIQSYPRLSNVSPGVVHVNAYGYPGTRVRDRACCETRSPEALRMTLDERLVTGGSFYATAFDFAQIDPCAVSPFRLDFVSAPMARLIRAREGDQPGSTLTDEAFFRAIGCETPKLGLAKRIIYAETDQEAVDLIKNTVNIDDFIILRNVPRQVREIADRAASDSSEIARSELQVLSFSANRLIAKAMIAQPRGAWLVYKDAAHPGWQATVDGKPQAVTEANIAFKAIFLKPGEHVVQFYFWGGMASLIAILMAIIGLLFAMGVLAAAFGLCFNAPFTSRL